MLPNGDEYEGTAFISFRSFRVIFIPGQDSLKMMKSTVKGHSDGMPGN